MFASLACGITGNGNALALKDPIASRGQVRK